MKHRGRSSKFIDTTTGNICPADTPDSNRKTITTPHQNSNTSKTCSSNTSTTASPLSSPEESPAAAGSVAGSRKPSAAKRSTTSNNPPLPALMESSPIAVAEKPQMARKSTTKTAPLSVVERSQVVGYGKPPITGRSIPETPSLPVVERSPVAVPEKPLMEKSTSESLPNSLKNPARKPTARKSTSRSGIRVSMFRCGDVFSIRPCNTEEVDLDDSSPASSGTSGATSSLDSGISQSAESTHPLLFHSPLIRCYLCNFSSRSMTVFADHLRRFHTTASSSSVCSSLRIEILAADDPTTARRCGLCPSYGGTLSDEELADHFSGVHGMGAVLPPLVCTLCWNYASFRVSQLHRHFAERHPHSSPDFRPLSRSYSTHPADPAADVELCESADKQAAVAVDVRDVRCTLNPVVRVMDIADMSQRQFTQLLDQHAVWFD